MAVIFLLALSCIISVLFWNFVCLILCYNIPFKCILWDSFLSSTWWCASFMCCWVCCGLLFLPAIGETSCVSSFGLEVSFSWACWRRLSTMQSSKVSAMMDFQVTAYQFKFWPGENIRRLQFLLLNCVLQSKLYICEVKFWRKNSTHINIC